MISYIYFIIFLLLSVLSMFTGVTFFMQNFSIIIEYSFMNVNSLSLVYIILLDHISLMFLSLVFMISSSVILYSKEYMMGDYNFNRFILLVVMFVFSMMLVIVSPNLMSIILGWDGLGLVSYCLVIYYQNEKSFNSGMLTILSNRLGDVAILMSIVWMMNYGSWNFLYYLSFIKFDYEMMIISVLVIIASFTKSAQIPFSSWLPAAMAAPTPVSSLVHSSTLVTAGVYLLMRFCGGFNYNFLMFILYISVMTMFMAGLGANFEFDLKKIIALSTLSQLGLMISILFLGDFNLAFLHLMTHALFKASLFMCAGYVIHVYGGCQDIRFMGGMINKLPMISTYMNLCSFSLCGFPFFSGFYSKDLIIEMLFYNNMNFYIFIVYMISVGLTMSYTIRLMNYMMGDGTSYFSLNSFSESFSLMLTGISILIFFVITSGSMLMWLFMNPYYLCLSFFMKIFTLMMIILGFSLGNFMFSIKYYFSSLSLNNYMMTSFVGMMWNLPFLSTLGVVNYPLKLIKISNNSFDQGWFEYYGSTGGFKLMKFMNGFIQGFSSNHLKVYIMLMMIWFLIMFLVI
uniref:NADH-ubiquinone oxidoreductase chain 5 n=1 Tax=Callispa bowringii TaxID=2558238 RepID=A0A482JPX9_9CUCU|nr:NADH dehydrogenase subunit 5 [Callispa bowringii]QBP33864.1 NADH dehydrogenase subunit 5 [Callispa bowringii]